MEHPIAWDLDFFNLRGAPYPEAAQGTWVTSGYMEGFGIRRRAGRAFRAADFAAGAPSVALISHRLWQTRFGGDRPTSSAGASRRTSTIGRTSRRRFTVVGVLPEGMWHLNVFTECMAPLRAPTLSIHGAAAAGRDAGSRSPGASRRWFAPAATSRLTGWRVERESAHANYVGQIRPLLIALATPRRS